MSVPTDMSVLMLTSQFPNPYYPEWGAFARQEASALARVCRLEVVAPIWWPWLWKNGHMRPPAAQQVPFPVHWPVYWYLPRFMPQWLGKAYYRSAWPMVRRRAAALGRPVVLGLWAYPDLCTSLYGGVWG